MLQQIKTLQDINGIFNRFTVTPSSYFSLPGLIPEGYDLVEQKEHKLTRLNSELELKKRNLQYHEKSVVSLSKEIEELEKEIATLS